LKAGSIRRLVSIGLIGVLVAFYALHPESSPYFLSLRFLFNDLLRNAAYLGIVACGLSVVIIGGGIDLSVGGIVCATGIICSRLLAVGIPGYIVIPLGIVFGILLGALNGYLIAWVGLTEFVATLATGFVYTGLGLLLSFKGDDGRIITRAIDDKFYLALGKSFWSNGLFPITVAWILLTVGMYIVLRKTKFGMHTYSVGSNSKAATMNGVNVKVIKASGFVISGAFAAIAAIFVTARLGTTQPALGNGYDFMAVAACVVGGIILGGGRGDSINAFLGTLFLLLLDVGMSLFPKLGVTGKDILYGVIIIVATAFDALSLRVMARRLKAKAIAAQVLEPAFEPAEEAAE